MGKQDIKENVEILEAMLLTYENCTFVNEEMLRQCLIRKIVRTAMPIFRWAVDWIDKYRNGHLTFEIHQNYLELSNMQLYGNYDEENLKYVIWGLELVNSVIFGKD